MNQTLLQATLSELEVADLAARLAALLVPGDCVVLYGDLGAGKTTFARALIRAVVADPALEVPSPTFALRQDYAGAHGVLVHFDLYRIVDPGELDEIGFHDAVAEAISVVEWPARAGDLLPEDRIDVALDDADSPDFRVVTVRAHGPAGPRLVAIAGATHPKCG